MSNPYQSPQANVVREAAADASYMPTLFTVSGRIGRVRYLAYSMAIALLAYVLMFIVAGGIGVGVGVSGDAETGMMAGFGVIILISLLTIPFSVIIMRRRLHDLDKSGWMCLLMIIPLVNFFFALYLLFAQGSENSNRFGPPPGPNTTGVLILAWLIPGIAILGILAAILIPFMVTTA